MRNHRSRRYGYRPGSERGTTLLLFPAAVLVLLILGGIAVDMSTVHLARRELYRTASQAADDAASVLDQQALRNGVTRIDGEAAVRVVRFNFATSNLPGELIGDPIVRIQADDTVEVTASMTVERVFGRVAPGAPSRDVVSVTARGRIINYDGAP